MCNSSVAAIFYSIITIIASIYGYDEEWSINAPLCSFRAYCFNVAIAAICYSKCMHAISRFFFAVLYKHRYLLTWRVHRILIFVSWMIGIILCTPPFFIKDGYALEIESRSCVISTKKYLIALYVTVVSCIIPFNTIIFVYILILYYVHRSTRRVFAFNENARNVNNHIPRYKRQMKLMQQMIIQTGILLSGGPVFLFLVIWHGTQTEPPPEWLYLLAFNTMTIVAATVPVVQFIMNKQFRQIFIKFFKQRQRTIEMRGHIQRQRQAWHIA